MTCIVNLFCRISYAKYLNDGYEFFIDFIPPGNV